ncbi:MAG TPA: hypothetical protein VHJ39_20435 [Solirubrobacteraceae bacterium]|jgi:hypothetical protein|nr:hypothetical protein [Solirubrobacteraceae bacterium]
MDVHEALAGLDLPRDEGYYPSRIPSAEDSRIGRVVKAFTAAAPGWQVAFRDAIDPGRADLLCAWSERMAALAVRLDSARPLVLGLVALTLADEAGDGEAFLVAPLHRRSAEKLGTDAFRLFDEAAGLTDLPGARWLEDARDADDEVEDSGYAEDEDADGFRYVRTVSALRRRY